MTYHIDQACNRITLPLLQSPEQFFRAWVDMSLLFLPVMDGYVIRTPLPPPPTKKNPPPEKRKNKENVAVMFSGIKVWFPLPLKIGENCFRFVRRLKYFGI